MTAVKSAYFLPVYSQLPVRSQVFNALDEARSPPWTMQESRSQSSVPCTSGFVFCNAEWLAADKGCLDPRPLVRCSVLRRGVM